MSGKMSKADKNTKAIMFNLEQMIGVRIKINKLGDSKRKAIADSIHKNYTDRLDALHEARKLSIKCDLPDPDEHNEEHRKISEQCLEMMYCVLYRETI